MSLLPWDPFRELSGVRDRINRLFDETFTRGSELLPWGRERGALWQPAVDIFERENEIVVRANVPGVEQKDLDVRVDKEKVMIRGETREEKEETRGSYYRRERYYGAFNRVIPLDTPVVPEKAKASFKNGVLEIVLPKEEEEEKGKAVKLNIE